MLYVSSNGAIFKDSSSLSSSSFSFPTFQKSSSLLVTTIVEHYDTYRMKCFSERFTDFSSQTKVLFLSTYTDYTIRDYILFSKERFKVYNKFVDYKPFLVKSFVYLCNPLDRDFTTHQAFLWRCYFFSFVFAYEYDFSNVLYVPFDYDMTNEEFDYYVRLRANYTSSYKLIKDFKHSENSFLCNDYNDSKCSMFSNLSLFSSEKNSLFEESLNYSFAQSDMFSHSKMVQKGLKKTSDEEKFPDLSSLLFVSHKDFMKFFDACFRDLNFFSEKNLFGIVLSE